VGSSNGYKINDIRNHWNDKRLTKLTNLEYIVSLMIEKVGKGRRFYDKKMEKMSKNE